MLIVKRALVSVSDKRGLEDFVRGLDALGVEMLASGGTALAIERTGVPVTRVEHVTDTPELLGGRVKTLHPFIYAGILAKRDNPIHNALMDEMGIGLIDMVIVNLYPFQKCLEEGKAHDEMIENIDIGGVGLIRAASKNYKDVAVVVSPDRYGSLISQMQENGGIDEKTLATLAIQGFRHTRDYDTAIHSYLAGEQAVVDAPVSSEPSSIILRKVSDLRYGENPHQAGTLYAWTGGPSVGDSTQIQGMPMSYNNYLDQYAAAMIVKDFEEPAVVVIKHTNPCGVATAFDHVRAYKAALKCDKRSAFGGIVGVNGTVEKGLADEIIKIFTEVVVAPDYSEDALSVFKKKKNLRVIKWPNMMYDEEPELEMRSIGHAFMGQTLAMPEEKFTIPTKRGPTKEEWESLRFAWKVASRVKSNAIVVAQGTETVSIGAGQMSRIDSVEIAVRRAGKLAKNAVLASDGFFPFRDSVDKAADAGISAIIQPGGSIKDKDVVKAADQHGIAMVVTGVRTFLH